MRLLFCILGGLALLLPAAGQELSASADSNAKLKQEAYPPMHRLTWEEYVGTLTHWRQKFPKAMSLESRGISGQNMPVYLLKITDSTVPAADKQICLITTLHSGPERTGTGGLAGRSAGHAD